MKLPEVESRTQGWRPRPRTQKKFEAKANDSLSEDRHSRGQGQECSRPRQGPRTQAQVLSKKKRSSQKFFKRPQKKKVFPKNFQAISTNKRFPKNFSSASQNFNNSKNSAVLERGQANFRGLDLRCQGLQNLSSRPRTSSRTPPLEITNKTRSELAEKQSQ